MELLSILSLAAALAAALFIRRRRLVWALGRQGPALAPAFMLVAWFAFLNLGESFGSLRLMGLAACLPLAAVAAAARAWSKPMRRTFLRWSVLEWGAFLVLGCLVFAVRGYDDTCHHAVVSTYLRGNIPPVALNAPTFSLMYHTPFDAAAALVVDAFGLDVILALRLVSLVCLAAALSGLVALCRLLFAGVWARAFGRLFFLFGFGPVYLRLHFDRYGTDLGVFHGMTSQSFVEAMLRWPMQLNFVVFIFLLASLLPKVPPDPGRGVPPALLLPCAFLLPLASEELTLFGLLFALYLGLKGRWPLGWLAAWLGLLLLGAARSGVFAGALVPGRPFLCPVPALDWPPSLPQGLSGLHPDGLPLFSREALEVVLLEWGPLFFCGLAAAAFHPRRQVLAAVFVFGFAIAACLDLGPWPKADTDRFLFYGTCAGFMLQAVWVEGLERRHLEGALSWPAFAGAAIFLAALTMAGPLLYLAGIVREGIPRYWVTSEDRLTYDAGALHRALEAVGPRDLIETDDQYAFELVRSGFVVAAPLTSPIIGNVSGPVGPHLAGRSSGAPRWLFLPAGDRRVAAGVVVAEYGGYVLVRAQ
ncbi:MAG: hypothetical protein WC943_05590 [Elusimicrobiota bacterium]